MSHFLAGIVNIVSSINYIGYTKLIAVFVVCFIFFFIPNIMLPFLDTGFSIKEGFKGELRRKFQRYDQRSQEGS